MSDSPAEGLRVKIDAEGVDVDVGEKTIERTGGALSVIFSKRRAKAEVDAAMGHRLAEKLGQGDLNLNEIDKFFLAQLYSKEIKRLQNQQSILGKATALIEQCSRQLPMAGATSDEQATSEDWADRFLRYAEDVNDQRMQELYARVAAGEYLTPGSYSLVTLEVLRKLDARSLAIFERVCNWRFSDQFLLQASGEADEQYQKGGVTYADLLHLDSVGLINARNSSMNPKAVRQTRYAAGIVYGSRAIRVQSDTDFSLAIRVWTFTSAGLDLARIPAFQHDEEFFSLLIRVVQRAAPKRPDVTLDWTDDGATFTRIERE